MKFFEQAQLNFKKSNFFKAIELFELSLKEEPLSVAQKILSCESIQKINECLNKSDSEEQLLLLGESYLDSGNFEKAAIIFQTLFEQTDEVYYIEKQYYSLVQAGHVEESIYFANLYLSELSSRRQADQILTFIKENQALLDPKVITINSLRALVLSGNRYGLNQEVLDWSSKTKEEKTLLTQTLIELTSHNTKFWHAGENILKYLWEEVIGSESNYFVTKKWLSKLIMDFWLTRVITHEVITGTVELSLKYNLAILGHELAKFLGDETLADDFLMSMPREAMLGDNFDFAKDLLDGESESEVSKIEKNIKFFISTKNKAEAVKQAYRLERLDPENILVKELISRPEWSDLQEGQELVSDLLDEIGKYSKLEQEHYDYETSFLSMVKYYAEDVIQRDFEDMVIGFNLLDAPKVSLEILKRVDISKLNIRDEVNFYYLEIETLLKQESYYKARDIIEDALNKMPLVRDELLTFQYLRAEAYYFLGFLEVALAQYKQVKETEENYRLTEERIIKIEKDK